MFPTSCSNGRAVAAGYLGARIHGHQSVLGPPHLYGKARGGSFSEDEQTLYDMGFGLLRPRESVSLLLAGEWKTAAAGDAVLTQGNPVSAVCIAISGV